MDKKTFLAIIAIIGGGLMVSRYVDVGNGSDNNIPRAFNVRTSSGTAGPSHPDSTGLNSFAGVIDKVRPSLVNISSVRFIEVRRSPFEFHFGDPFDDFFEDFFPERDRRRQPREEPQRFRHEGTGSGFIVDSEGYVLTNYHVIEDAEEIKVTLYDEETYDAKVVGQDPRTDLAVVKIEASREFTPLAMGDSERIRVGDWVIAAGSPFGLEQTFTAGIISAKRQDVQVQGQSFGEMIQTDASINRGNSGGPLVDRQGRAVGINTAIFAPTGVFSGVGFAIPIDNAVRILDQLIEVGKVVRGWLGVEIREVDEVVMEQFGLESEDGALINRVYEGTPAQEAGVKRGDVIVEVNGEKVENVRNLQDLIGAASPGDTVVLSVVRDGDLVEIDVELSEMPDEMPDEETEPEAQPEEEIEVEWKGIYVRDIDEKLKEKNNLETEEGVIVLRIDSDAEAYGIGLNRGDIIRQINRKEIKNLEDFKKVSEEISLSEGVVFDVLRNGRPVYLSYRKR
ncbi:MAG: Do family serine endopeptidase [Elusimicrobiota bacterium]